jgi:hypothetical protein
MPRTSNNQNTGQGKGEAELPEIVMNFVEPVKSFNTACRELESVWFDEGAKMFHNEYYEPFGNITKDYLLALANYHDMISKVTEVSKSLVSGWFAGTNGVSIANIRMVWNRLPRRVSDWFSGGWKG